MEKQKKQTSRLIQEVLSQDLQISPYPTSVADRIEKFSQMLNDDQVSASVFSRMSKSINQNIQVKCDDENIATFLSNQLKNIKDTDLHNILTCIIYGFSVIEIVYEKNNDNMIGLQKLVLKNPKYFAIDESGEFVYKPNDTKLSDTSLKNKIVKSVYMPTFSNPFGTSVLSMCYYYYEFKKLGWANWSKAFSRLANPMILLITEDEYGVSDPKAIKSLLEKVESGSSMFLQGIKETKILSDPQALESPKVFIEECNKAISRAITGTTMITNTPEYGTNALGSIQNDNFYEYLKLDKAILQEALQNIVNNLMELNFEDNITAKVYFDDDKNLTFDQYIKLYQAGIPFDLDDMFEKFNIKKPKI